VQPRGQRDKPQEVRPSRAGLAADSALALALAVVLTVATYFVSQHRVFRAVLSEHVEEGWRRPR